jgi:hypothetical protein
LEVDDTYGTPMVLVSGSSFHANAAGFGGGVSRRNGGLLTIQKSSFVSNSGYYQGGGAIAFSGSDTSAHVLVQSVTFIDNSGDGGSVVYNSGAGVDLYSDTIVGNLNTAVYTTGGNTRFRDTVLQNFLNCVTTGAGSTSDDLANFTSDLSCKLPASKQGDPMLGVITQDPNGVTTFLRPLAGSPLIDKGVACPATDQIGIPPFGASCDIGASEYTGN